jgi:hypothetical protein
VDHLDHWTNTHKALPITCSTNDNKLATTAWKMRCHRHMVHSDKPTGHPKRPPALLTSKRHMTPPALQKITPPRKPSAQNNKAHNRQRQHLQVTKHTRTNSTATNQPQQQQVSQMSNEKWHTQVQHFLTKWTPQHMDAYLAIPEVAMEWIVEPG